MFKQYAIPFKYSSDEESSEHFMNDSYRKLEIKHAATNVIKIVQMLVRQGLRYISVFLTVFRLAFQPVCSSIRFSIMNFP